MGKLIFLNQTIDYTKLSEVDVRNYPDFVQSAIAFCTDWLNGKESFTLSTSGSTGIPKQLTVSRTQMEHSALATCNFLQLKKNDTALVALNTSFVAGKMMLVRGLLMDMNLLIVPPDSNPFETILENIKIDFTALVPMQLASMLENGSPKTRSYMNGMKAIIVGGAALSESLIQEVQLVGSPVFATYGMTETLSHIALQKVNGFDKQDYYECLPSVSIGVDERSCLKICSPVTNNEWIQTNDVVEVIDAHRFSWKGRADSIVNSGGLKLQPEAIEKQLEPLLLKYGIHQFFLAGLPHPTLGEALTLFVESTSSLDLGPELEQRFRPLLDRYCIPKAIIGIPTFTYTPTGKINRLVTKSPFQNFYTKQ